ncbi:MBL fold metallo-hydrolase [Novosphingobium sp. P6W]|uniref:MBL fold metallo-hydrolase n=1 Tax=Novosphingobium sp. P6W TaxID=1609758 RepID=UPI0013B39E31|nr:MBL fold metallo-hydrolase [Novosphingobium sp. P6W]
MQQAEALAAKDLRPLYEVLCPAEVLHPPAVQVAERATWYAPPGRAFDDLFYVGQQSVSAWALKTDDGLVLIDALFNYSVGPEIVEGLKTLGLDPATIRYVVVSHGHADHYGGARYIQDTFGARIVASRKDWDVIEAETGATDPKPRRDIVVDRMLDLRIGNTNLNIVETPGHTPGTLSMLFPVHDRGKRHEVALWGGTAFNSRTREQYENLAASAERFANRDKHEHCGCEDTAERGYPEETFALRPAKPSADRLRAKRHDQAGGGPAQ